MKYKHLGKIAVLYGGNSSEREVSLKSGHAVINALVTMGVNAHGFDTRDEHLTELLKQGYSRALIMLHGPGGEDGSLQGALEQLDIPYTGSGVLGSALAMNKAMSKQLWCGLGLPTPDFQIVYKALSKDECQDALLHLGGSIMVKPVREGSSIGIAKAESVEQLETAVESALQYDDQILLEKFITGDEFTVSILAGQALPSIHMKSTNTFYDYDAKYCSNDTQYFCPSGLDESAELALRTLALNAFNSLQCSGWGRVDFMRDANGKFYLLEANTVPGMTEKSLVPMAAKAKGMTFGELCLAILNTVE
jgi:D-alanine-D-alanine ligase